MQLSNAVNMCAAGSRQISHADLRIIAGSHDPHTVDLCTVISQRLQKRHETLVDLLDDLHMAREQFPDQACRPDLKRFRKKCMACVVESARSDIPRSIPVIAIFINKDTHKFRDPDYRMGIVELECDLIREGSHIRLILPRIESTDSVVQ